MAVGIQGIFFVLYIVFDKQLPRLLPYYIKEAGGGLFYYYLLFLKFLGDILQQLADGQVLRADALALAAADAVRCH